MPAMDTDVAIIGSGFAGLGMAIRLKQAGRDDFLVLERGDDVGGTWHYNTYPGCACDVPSHLYSFSFAPNPGWSRTYSHQPEILRYLRRCADDFGVRGHVRFSCEVSEARWDGRWRLETSDGTISARVLVSATGALAESKLPDIPGIDRFEGPRFHTAQWDHGFECEGRRVAVIGTGASAIQVVPAIAGKVAHLDVYQRTPPWVTPHTGRPVSALEQRLYKALPPLQRLLRGGIYAARELLVLGFVKDPRLMKVVERVSRRHIERQVRDPELLAKVTPDYTIGCKRILPSNDWYPALGRDNVDLHTSAIAEIRERSIVTEDGLEREVDALVFGTGFHVTDMPAAQFLHGREGKSLDEVWQGSPRALLGTAIAGFPNLFLLLGPNTGLGHSSMVYMIESQIAHVLAALRAMDADGAAAAEARPEAVATYNADLDERMQRTVWTTGCSSWYVDRTGRNSALWPDWTWRFRQRAGRFEEADYRLLEPAREPVAA